MDVFGAPCVIMLEADVTSIGGSGLPVAAEAPAATGGAGVAGVQASSSPYIPPAKMLRRAASCQVTPGLVCQNLRMLAACRAALAFSVRRRTLSALACRHRLTALVAEGLLRPVQQEAEGLLLTGLHQGPAQTSVHCTNRCMSEHEWPWLSQRQLALVCTASAFSCSQAAARAMY